MGFFNKLKEGLAKTKNAFVGKIDNLFKSFRKVDEELFEELEELLISADIGVNTTEDVFQPLCLMQGGFFSAIDLEFTPICIMKPISKRRPVL